jgi:parallel beta-helix repeat protein
MKKATFGKVLLFSIGMMIVQSMTPGRASAATYFISTTGNDTTGDGTQSAPYKTFSKGISVLNPGDELKVAEGIYNDRMVVNRSGTANAWIKITPVSGRPVIDLNFTQEKLLDVTGSYVEVSGFELQEAKEASGNDGRCANVTGQYVVLNNLQVHDCRGHGIQVESAHVTVQNSEIYRTNLNYSARNLTSGWGSGLKVRVGGNDVKLLNNTIYHNYGEGIAVTRGTNVLVAGNTTYDNYGVNIYVDNAYDVVVERNFSYCTGNTEYDFLNGKRPAAFQLAEEYYDGWGAQLNNVTLRNNIAAFWGAKQTGISISELPQTTGTEIANNINHFDAGGKHAVIISRTGINMHHNFWIGSAPEDWMLASGIGDITGAAQLQSTPSVVDAASFKLSATSPAIDAAGAVGVAVSTDFANATRGQTADIGAYEYGGTVVVSPSPSTSPSPTTSPSSTPEVSPSPSPTYCQMADINQDGIVNLFDYSLLASNFFSNSPNPIRADINSDGKVNLLDYSWLATHFMQSC